MWHMPWQARLDLHDIVLYEALGMQAVQAKKRKYERHIPLSPPSPIPPSPPPQPEPARPVPRIPSNGMTKGQLKRKIQAGVQDRVSLFWREKISRYVMQGDYLSLIMAEDGCLTWRSFMWDVPQGVLRFAINAGINTLPSLDNLKRWGKRVSDRCSFCGNTQTLAHILSNCSVALDQGRFTWRHDSVLSSIINLVRPHLMQGMILFSDMPGYQAPHGGTIPPHIITTNLKPDIVIIDEDSRRVIIFELTCPWDTNIDRSHTFKEEKYAPLIADLSRSFTVFSYSVEISARGQVTKANRARLKCFTYRSCTDARVIFKSIVKTCSKAALLASFSVFSARNEPSWLNPSPLVVKQ